MDDKTVTAEALFLDRIRTGETAGFQKREIIEAMQEYARLKVAEQRKLTATFLAQNFNMRNIPRPNID